MSILLEGEGDHYSAYRAEQETSLHFARMEVGWDITTGRTTQSPLLFSKGQKQVTSPAYSQGEGLTQA